MGGDEEQYITAMDRSVQKFQRQRNTVPELSGHRPVPTLFARNKRSYGTSFFLNEQHKDIRKVVTKNCKNDSVVSVKEEHLESHYLEPDDFFIDNLQFEETVDVKNIDLQIDSKDHSPQCNDCEQQQSGKSKGMRPSMPEINPILVQHVEHSLVRFKA
ncbi:hypothetical protein EVAR_53409_1 [Eumeta japonica]|uniref:Uncharacterized protein n=1 Tax=Eumeta variegata TaxID=151549 RepID=A0A4C1XT64_EUMVA|nr:hypothetical protein EVAR_53409_1 [Eumeta japonica]